MEGKQQRIRPDEAFKRDAIRLVLEENRPVSKVARDLGMHPNTLHRWIKEYRDAGEDAFPGHGRLLPQDEEVRRLKRALEQVTEERDILKKAMAVFSRRP